MLGPKFDFYNVVWFHNYGTKMSKCLLRTQNGKPLTRTFLKDLNIIDSDMHALCNLCPETLQHMCLHMLPTLWKLCKLKVGILDS